MSGIWRFLIYDIGGKMVGEYSELQSVDEGGVKYLLSDWQGSNRAVVSNAGFVTGRTDYTAFGEEIGANVGLRTTGQKFGSNQTPRQKYGLTERDQGTGLDHTWFRKHENRAGRWTSPDPYGGSMSIRDPQSFNRYSYVENQPTNFIDPSGLTMAAPAAARPPAVGRICGIRIQNKWSPARGVCVAIHPEEADSGMAGPEGAGSGDWVEVCLQ